MTMSTHIQLDGLIKKNTPLFACMECGKKFYSAKAAEKASFGDNGCPGCGGSDIDVYLERDAQ